MTPDMQNTQNWNQKEPRLVSEMSLGIDGQPLLGDGELPPQSNPSHLWIVLVPGIQTEIQTVLMKYKLSGLQPTHVS